MPTSHATRRLERFAHWLAVAAALALSSTGLACEKKSVLNGIDLNTATLADLSAALDARRVTSTALATAYLKRIKDCDGELHAIISTNPNALADAQRLDAERQAGKIRGPLHGVPIVIKDNIDLAGTVTTAGSLALIDNLRDHNAPLVDQLVAAGVVVIAKSNLSEWANIRSNWSSSGWSAVGGLAVNAHDSRRTACGSSSGSGTAVAAHLAPAAIGTETNGSVTCPSSVSGLVGIKPTVGLVSRSGIIPISHSQDTAGPMARTVADAAELLAVLSGPDPRDPATAASRGKAAASYANVLNPAALKGVRLGVARSFFGFSAAVDRIMDEAIAAMKSAGAIIVDPANITTSGKFDDAEGEVLNFEFKADLNAYLAALGPSAPRKTLADLIAFNDQNADREMPYFGQEQFLKAQAKGPLTSPAYKAAREKCLRMSRTEGIDATLTKHRVVAIVAPTGGPAWPTDLLNGDHFTGSSSTPAAVSGYPSVTVPAGYVHGLPVGISFIGGQWSDGTLIGLAYAFEQATKVRRPPRFEPTVKL